MSETQEKPVKREEKKEKQYSFSEYSQLVSISKGKKLVLKRTYSEKVKKTQQEWRKIVDKTV